MNPLTREMVDKFKDQLLRAREEMMLREPPTMTKAEFDRFLAEHRDEIEALAEMLDFPPLG